MIIMIIMVATVAVFFDNGGTNGNPSAQTDTSSLGPPNLRFKTADNSTIDNQNPIPIPSGSAVNSFWKQIYLKVTGGTFTQIDNVKFYTDGGGFGTGITTFVGNQLPVKNSGANTGYVVATGTVGTSGNAMVASHAGISAQTDAFTFTSGSPKAITISEAGGLMNATNETTNYLVCQMNVANNAGPGNLADETWTYQYDEI
jgi:hypothetical protein|tara:strand:- start:1069 stop:1671 length:603 start_codon:yes stop_codon:yes gene_type:complete